MVQRQDSTDPTGVAGQAGGNHPGGVVVNGNNVGRARTRKANAAIQMRLGGATWSEIAIALGFPTPRTALVATEKALEKELRSHGDRDALRALAGARLDRLLRGVWPKAINDEHPEQMVAVGKSRELIADYRKLFGLDAPVEVVVHNPTLTELEAWVARVAIAAGPTVVEYDIIDGDEVDDAAATG